MAGDRGATKQLWCLVMHGDTLESWGIRENLREAFVTTGNPGDYVVIIGNPWEFPGIHGHLSELMMHVHAHACKSMHVRGHPHARRRNDTKKRRMHKS